MFLDVKGTAAYAIKRKSAMDRMLSRGRRHYFIADGRGLRPTATSAEGVGFIMALAKGRGALRCCRVLAFRQDCEALHVTYSS